jgi:hypothetical protein
VVFDFASATQERGSIKDYKVDRFILYPKHWGEYSNTISLSWNKVKFTDANADVVPNDKTGVYSFVVDPFIAQHPACGYLLYIGKVKDQNLRTRYRQYLRAEQTWKARPHIASMIQKWSGYLYFYYAEVSDTSLINQLEEDLITAFLPPENRSWPAKITKVMRMVI